MALAARWGAGLGGGEPGMVEMNWAEERTSNSGTESWSELQQKLKHREVLGG